MQINFSESLKQAKNANIFDSAQSQVISNDVNNLSLQSVILRENISVQNPIKNDMLALLYPIKFIALYCNYDFIKKATDINSNISDLLNENKLPLKIDINNIIDISLVHLIPTARLAQKIYCAMGHNKDEINYLYLSQAALLHDIGKVFIPCEILNKSGKLTSKEREIVRLHNILSFEILKTSDLNPLVSQLALEHHNHNKEVKPTQENQALTIADIYCALREKRPYKKPMNDICAKTILYSMGADKIIDSKYINLINS